MSSALSEFEVSRFWWVAPFWRKCCHRSRRWVRAIIDNRFLSVFVPTTTGLYFAVLDIWKDEIGWVKNHIELHQSIFFWCVAASLGLLGLRGFADAEPPASLESDDTANRILASFITTVGGIVQAKINRFRERLPHLTKNTNKFLQITKPEEQFGVIGNATVNFLMHAFEMHENQVDITIIRRRDGGGWQYEYKYQSWNHTIAGVIMANSKSIAHRCLQLGEDIFVPDKIAAAVAGQYMMTQRDKHRRNGSAYAFPVRYTTANGTVECVVSIVTYGRQLCEVHQVHAVEITKSFLREICRRFEMELCLHTIKTAV